MWIYTIRRFNLFVITLLILTLIGFNILRLDDTSAWAQTPFLSGWLTYLGQLLNGNLGVNQYGVNMLDEILRVFPATIELCFFAFFIALIIGTPIGTIAGMRRGKPLDTLISSIALVGYSMPLFWIALLVLMFFSLQLEGTPVSSRYNLLYEFDAKTGFAFIDVLTSKSPYRAELLENIIQHLILPTLVLSIAPMTEVVRLMRSSVATVITQNYIKVAHTKGLSKFEIMVKHIIRNALPPIIPKLGVQLSGLFTAAILTESIFNWPGVGRWLLDAVTNQDYVAIQAGVITVASFILLANILSDLLGAAVNPLVRKEFYALK
ncbi:ABC transporter permease [Aliivibrio fischeri]|uniref:ABC transporter permease subunit n=1 Tax=Aliivibrio fischeri TaxID=668 RepID=A0A510UFN7_ALIFS|nr:ABC transporter permease subunit [Aliivibrio fischeri]MUK49432.1 ABC transporter permease subunit [Aliivibrio fischeri]MUK66629.1 ABC transporter permease subunit [Aliivibrio fischeri]GEK13359.1 antimicrobial peptide ABC transporter permease SapB [Aliivibrio fischeri]